MNLVRCDSSQKIRLIKTENVNAQEYEKGYLSYGMPIRRNITKP